MIKLLGVALIILAILAIVGFISNAKQFGNKIWTNKMYFYIFILVIGLYLLFFM